MIVLAFDRDWTVDVNPHPNREAVPLEYVTYWNEKPAHEVWATGNQLLVNEANIPGTVETVRRLKGDLSLLGDKDEQTGRYERWPERETRLKMLEELFPDAEQYIVVDDLNLEHVGNWDHYYAWDFMEALRQGELPLEIPDRNDSQRIQIDRELSEHESQSSELAVHPTVSYRSRIQETDGTFGALHPLQPDLELVETHRAVTDTDHKQIEPGPTSDTLAVEADAIRKQWLKNATSASSDTDSSMSTRAIHETELVSRLDRAVGIMVGLACGDALGRPVEFKQPRQIKAEYGEVRDFHGDGSHGQPAGTLTDDTAQAVYLISVLLEANGFDKELYAERLVEWLEVGPFDVGMTTLSSLKYLQGDVNPDKAGEKTLAYRGPGQAAGNGSVMRCAPLAIAYPDKWDELQRVSRESSHITHADSRCTHGAAVLNLTLAALINGSVNPLADALDALSDDAPNELVDRLRRVPDELEQSELNNSGYVLDTLETSLYIGLTADSAEDALTTAVNMGGDADTIGAVTGAIVGARFGAGRRMKRIDDDRDHTFPKRWTNNLTPDIMSFEKSIVPSLLEIGQISDHCYTADRDVADNVYDIARKIN